MKKLFTKETFRKVFYSFVWIAVLVFICDIVTKWSFYNYFYDKFGELIHITNYDAGVNPASIKENMIQIIPGFLYIGFAFNLGAAFSSLQSGNFDGVNPILIAISVLLTAILIVFYIKTFKKNRKIVNICLMLMIGGAFGNMIDRIFYRKSITGFRGVMDFIQAYPFGKRFAIFNIADSALVVGVAILLVVFIIDEIKDAIEKGKKGEYKYSPKELKEQKENAKNSSKK